MAGDYTMAQKHTSNQLEDKIFRFLNDKVDGATALQIAKGVGLKTAKDVNSVLYGLEKTDRLFRNSDQPPLWTSRNRPAATVKKSEPTDDLAEDLRKLMLSNSTRKGFKSHELAAKLNVPRKEVTKRLHGLSRSGEVKRLGETSLWQADGPNEGGRLITYQGDDQDCSIKLKEDSRFFVDFQLISVLGAGGFGCVVTAKHKKDKKIYAVKILEYTSEANREIRALASLKHPNIVSYYTCWDEAAFWIKDFDDDDNTTSSQDSYSSENEAEYRGRDVSCLFIKMEFCEKGTLKDWIRKENEGTKKALYMFQQIITGVQYIHSEGHIHRDLKPENVFIGKDDTLKIGDFGHVTTSSPVSRTLDKGTPIYMSPEQRTETVYDMKTDIYALGLIFFEMLWKMPTDTEKYKLFSNLQSRQEFPQDFKNNYAAEHHIIKKMLSKTPTERPDAEEIARYLEDILLSKSTTLQQKSA